MGFALLASATRGLFIAMLIIMIVVSALFALIVFIALRPVKKPQIGRASCRERV